MSDFLDLKFDKKYKYLNQYTNYLKKPEREIVGREKEKEEILAAFMRPELCNVILLAPAGSGKGHPNTTKIAVNDNRGYIAFGDLKIGDEVFDKYGNPTKVIGIYPQGLKDVYRVHFRDGSFIDCNDEHIWNVRSRDRVSRDLPYQNFTLRELLDKGIKDSQGYNKWRIPTNNYIKRDSISLPIDPYLLGVLIGDGLMRETSLIISSGDIEVVDKVSSIVSAKFYKRNNANYCYTFYEDEGKRINLQNLFSWDEDCYVYGKKSIEKRIPPIFFNGSYEQRLSLLQGLMDIDGCIRSKERLNASFSTNSECLAYDVKKLVTSLGYRASIRVGIRNDEIHKNPEYEVYIVCPPEETYKLFTLKRYHDYIDKYIGYERKFNKHYEDLIITDVEDLGYQAEMTCIMVDNEEHLYQVGEDHIVTHNTALMQSCSIYDSNRTYLEVDLAKMISNLNDPNEMAAKLKALFDEVSAFVKEEGKEIVLFIDEFHQIVQLSDAAVEALKPLLADSGTRGIRVAAATTYIEYMEYISDNQPLVERLQRMDIKEPDRETTVKILRGMAKRYGVENQFPNNNMFELIYEYTNRYIPSNAQPRKSILILDNMVGWYRLSVEKYRKTHDKSVLRPINKHLLADVIYNTEGINVAFRVDAESIRDRLDKAVISQKLATSVVENRLQICVADLNNKGKPMSSFLFTGSTGVGKALPNESKLPIYSQCGRSFHKKLKDIKVGDYVFAKDGSPTKVLGKFPQGKLRVWEIEFSDGRIEECSGDHIWTYKNSAGNGSKYWKQKTTEELYKAISNLKIREGRNHKLPRYIIPNNGEVQFNEIKGAKCFNSDNYLDSYVLGVAIADGSLIEDAFSIVTGDEFVASKCADRLNTKYKKSRDIYYNFYVDGFYWKKQHKNQKYINQKTLLSNCPEVYGKYSRDRSIPEEYKYGSIEQRWDLIHGLFDCDGSIEKDDRHHVLYSSKSEKLVKDIQEVLWSLGVQSSIKSYIRDDKIHDGNPEYTLQVMIEDSNKYKFFSLPRKLDICKKAAEREKTKKRIKRYNKLAIRDIRPTDRYEEMTCILVDNDEHLFLTGNYVVTHNTELSKQLADILFGTERALIRFDMTEYSSADSLERFRLTLTDAVWQRPYCILLFDEIEKANGAITRLLLQVLDDGRLINKNNRIVPFNNTYIIMTTNAASEIYKNIGQYASSDTGEGHELSEFNKIIRRSLMRTVGSNKFPPELLGRIDSIVPFQPLSENTLKKIVEGKIRNLLLEVKKKHKVVVNVSLGKKDEHGNYVLDQFGRPVDYSVIDYIVEDKYDTDTDSGGARGVISKLEVELVTPLSRFINLHPNVRYVDVRVKGHVAASDKEKLKSEAYIDVTESKRNSYEGIKKTNA